MFGVTTGINCNKWSFYVGALYTKSVITISIIPVGFRECPLFDLYTGVHYICLIFNKIRVFKR